MRRRRVASNHWASHTDTRGPVHVWPLADLIAHDTDTLDCICGPDLEWVDPKTGEAHVVPLVSHHSLDGRELR